MTGEPPRGQQGLGYIPRLVTGGRIDVGIAAGVGTRLWAQI